MQRPTNVTMAVNSIQATSRRTERFYLVLLCSQPDTVHRFLSRKTWISTSLTKGSLAKNSSRPVITPAIADCRYRAPLTPRLHGNFITLRVYIIQKNSSSTPKFAEKSLQKLRAFLLHHSLNHLYSMVKARHI